MFATKLSSHLLPHITQAPMAGANNHLLATAADITHDFLNA